MLRVRACARGGRSECAECRNLRLLIGREATEADERRAAVPCNCGVDRPVSMQCFHQCFQEVGVDVHVTAARERSAAGSRRRCLPEQAQDLVCWHGTGLGLALSLALLVPALSPRHCGWCSWCIWDLARLWPAFIEAAVRVRAHCWACGERQHPGSTLVAVVANFFVKRRVGAARIFGDAPVTLSPNKQVMNIAGFGSNDNNNKKQDLITLLTSGSPLTL